MGAKQRLSTDALCTDPTACKSYILPQTLKGHWAIIVNGNWRLTFTFEGEDAILVDYQDYH
ncbi:type II toxin-antitoxin system RelE/ParE family toxin [Salinicola halophyticus]|uniref:type II toxin-antitoxin system RelE/ParE family toxin n=1 Tax=Salinicola halophyticus TaxID=1808881 RepID=UPI003F4586CD